MAAWMPGTWLKKYEGRSAVPLDAFQLGVLRTLMRHRSPDSVFAGGSVLQRHGHRLSDDYDFFDEQARLINDPDRILTGDYQVLAVSRGGTWPSGPDIDRELIVRVIDEFGEDGSRYTGADPSGFQP